MSLPVEEIVRDLGMQLFFAPLDDNIFGKTYFETSTSLGNVLQKMSVPLSTVERFYSKNGVPIEEDNTYDYASRYSLRVGDAEHRYYIQQGEQTAALNFDREPRFYSTLGFDRGKWYGNSYKNMPDDDAECLFPKNRFGEVSTIGNPGQYNATGYWPKKTGFHTIALSGMPTVSLGNLILSLTCVTQICC